MSTANQFAEASGQVVKSCRKRGKKRKGATRFSGKQDVVLLQEVMSVNPVKDAQPTTAWASISKNIEWQLAVTPRRCRERTLLLLEKFAKEDFCSLHRHCTPEEFALKKELLQQVQQPYRNGAGGYKSRLLGSPSSAPQAPAEGKIDTEAAPGDAEGCRAKLNKDGSLEPSTDSPGTQTEQMHTQGSSSKDVSVSPNQLLLADARPSTSSAKPSSDVSTDDDMRHLDHLFALGESHRVKFVAQAVSVLHSSLEETMLRRERDLKHRRKELDVQWAKLRLEEERLSLEKAQFEVELAEHKRQLQFEKEQREQFIEQLNRLVNSANFQS